MKTLLIGADGAPIGVIPWTRAMLLLLTGKVVVLKESEQNVNSANESWFVPEVLMYTKKIKKRKRTPNFSRYGIFYRDKWTCQYCGKKGTGKTLTFDHVLPRKHGGVTSWTNIVTACQPCNRKKGSLLLKDSGMRLKVMPKKPVEQFPVFLMYREGKHPESWKDYLVSDKYWNAELEEA